MEKINVVLGVLFNGRMNTYTYVRQRTFHHYPVVIRERSITSLMKRMVVSFLIGFLKSIYLFGGAEPSFLCAFLLYREVSRGYCLGPVYGLLIALASVVVEPWALGQASIVVVHRL